MTKITDLIGDMQAVKAANPAMENADILRIFNIKALHDLSLQIKRLADKR